MYKIRRGLNLPITGEPDQVIQSSPKVKTVAVLGPDFHGMKPTMRVKVGDTVKVGSPLFEDKKQPGVIHTSPAAGKVTAVNRGDKRALQSVVIAVSGGDYEPFSQHKASSLRTLGAKQATDDLVKSGLWTRLRTRPFSRTPAIGSSPTSIFINLMDTNPLAPDPKVVLKGREEDFRTALRY